MKRILLDNHIFDRLKTDPDLCKKIHGLTVDLRIEIIVTRTIAEELYLSPHIDVLERFPYRYTGNTVGRSGLLRCGDSIGSGHIFYEHLGKSKKTNDAFIVDAASWLADWLVSDDARLCNRAKIVLKKCEVISFTNFESRILSMASETLEENMTDEPNN